MGDTLLWQVGQVFRSLRAKGFDMKQTFSWTVKCDNCDWSMTGWSVKTFCDEEMKRHKAKGCK
jgi:hypothetical protein